MSFYENIAAAELSSDDPSAKLFKLGNRLLDRFPVIAKTIDPTDIGPRGSAVEFMVVTQEGVNFANQSMPATLLMPETSLKTRLRADRETGELRTARAARLGQGGLGMRLDISARAVRLNNQKVSREILNAEIDTIVSTLNSSTLRAGDRYNFATFADMVNLNELPLAPEAETQIELSDFDKQAIKTLYLVGEQILGAEVVRY